MYRDLSNFTNQSIIILQLCGEDVRSKLELLQKKNIVAFNSIDEETNMFKQYGQPDIIVDDEKRGYDFVIEAYDRLYYKLKTNGLYIIKRSLKSNDNEAFTDFYKGILDRINAKWNTLDKKLCESTLKLTFYKDYIVFEKRNMGEDAVMSYQIPPTLSQRKCFKYIKHMIYTITIKIGIHGFLKRVYDSIFT
ncbi:MAG: hypothetical protein LBC73_06055 [Oscillospiraceae bacterium]|nr:hypothetical protein [Oscillospiraceae bacterium]